LAQTLVTTTIGSVCHAARLPDSKLLHQYSVNSITWKGGRLSPGSPDVISEANLALVPPYWIDNIRDEAFVACFVASPLGFSMSTRQPNRPDLKCAGIYCFRGLWPRHARRCVSCQRPQIIGQSGFVCYQD
jgi:hypothetical protein